MLVPRVVCIFKFHCIVTSRILKSLLRAICSQCTVVPISMTKVSVFSRLYIHLFFYLKLSNQYLQFSTLLAFRLAPQYEFCRFKAYIYVTYENHLEHYIYTALHFNSLTNGPWRVMYLFSFQTYTGSPVEQDGLNLFLYHLPVGVSFLPVFVFLERANVSHSLFFIVALALNTQLQEASWGGA